MRQNEDHKHNQRAATLFSSLLFQKRQFQESKHESVQSVTFVQYIFREYYVMETEIFEFTNSLYNVENVSRRGRKIYQAQNTNLGQEMLYLSVSHADHDFRIRHFFLLYVLLHRFRNFLGNQSSQQRRFYMCIDVTLWVTISLVLRYVVRTCNVRTAKFQNQYRVEVKVVFALY